RAGDAVQFRRTHGEMNQFATLAGDQQTIAILLVVRKLAEGYQVVGWIENQQVAQLGVLKNSRQSRGIARFRKLDGQNDVVESQVRRSLFGDDAAFVMHRNVIRVDADLRQHRGEHRGFVFAVAVTMSKYLSRWMRLQTSNTNFDGRV